MDQKAAQELRATSLKREPFSIFGILFLSLLCAVGLVGNLLVCTAIKLDRRLHNITNYFLFSLALTDLLVCGLVMPLSLVVEIHHGVWKWSFLMCLLYVYADVFLCSASIVHMSVISLDRYLGISKPLETRSKSKTRIAVKIVSVWIATVLISCPIAIMAFADSSNIFNDNICSITNRYYMIYGSTFAFLIPSLIMVVTCVRTISLLKRQPTLISYHGTSIMNHTEIFVIRRTCTPYNYTHKKFQGNISCGSKQIINHPLETLLTRYGKKELEVDSEAGLEKSCQRNFRKRTTMATFALTAKASKREVFPKRNAEFTNEHKATRVLAVVFACFFICWTPFFVANLAVGFCGERCTLPPPVAFFFLWLGYFSSTINPLIYTTFNRQFRQTFLRIFRCQCTYLMRSTYVGNYSRRQNDSW